MTIQTATTKHATTTTSMRNFRGMTMELEEMVGTARFELATSRTPSVRATRLRYVPTGKLTATGPRNQRPNRGGNQHLQGITAVRAASRKPAAYRANPAAFCGSGAAPRLPPHASRPRFPPRNFLHARAETAARPRW